MRKLEIMTIINITTDTKMEKHAIAKRESDFINAKIKTYITQFVKRVDEILKEYGSAAGAANRH